MEVAMHVHGHQANLSTINPYSRAAEQAAAAQRAANARKKLLRSADEIEDGSGHGILSPGISGQAISSQGISCHGEAFLVSRWMSPQQGHAHDDVEYHTAVAGKDSDFG
jgi:hypothetical protein